jgi:2-polyprenyl-3-methyl-5-hydroxy-6-metoxy-1,4-benzoquinol methylase
MAASLGADAAGADAVSLSGEMRSMLDQPSAAVTTTTRVCPVCGASDSRQEQFRVTGWLRRCQRCDMVFSESVEISGTLYEESFLDDSHAYHGYADEGERLLSGAGAHIAWGWRQFFQRVPVPQAGGRILDIGCSTGVFLAEAKRRGWREVVGIEISPSAAAFARRLLGSEVHEVFLEAVNLPAENFDAVTGYEVIEHVPDPRAFVREVARVLRRSGTATFSTPNWDSIWERKSRDTHRAPPFHLNYFTARTITKLLRDAGFTDIHTARKPFAWTEELGPSAPLQLPLSLLRSAILGQRGNRLFVTATRA